MRLLVVEDEPVLRQQIEQALSLAGYSVDVASDGRDALHFATQEPFDLIIMDLGLPYLDGLTVLKTVRSAGVLTPVLILTARDNWHDKVTGIDAGADDYLTKPFHMEELLARIRALIRRSVGLADAVLRCGALELDTRTSRLSENGRALTLTAHEYKVIVYLFHRMNQVISRADLTEHIYAQDFDRDSNTIDVFIGRLRKKITTDCIETVRGLGYRLRNPDV